MRAGWYKFNGGQQICDDRAKETRLFWKQHPEFTSHLQDVFECSFKAIASGEVNVEEYAAGKAKELGISGFQPWFLRNLPQEPIYPFKGKLL